MAYLKGRTTPRPQRLCSHCSQVCSYSYLQCSECTSWIHTPCESVDEEKAAEINRLTPGYRYICRKCRNDEERNLDFTRVMQRLRKAALLGFKDLQKCVQRERLFLDGIFQGFLEEGSFTSLAVDSTASFLLENYFNNDKGIPAVTSTMDHVLFRAVSLAVCAKDSWVIELRARCCIEMVSFEKFYMYHQRNYEELSPYTPNYQDSCIDCALIEEGSSLWTMSALASVIRRPILSVYPHVNGPSDPLVRLLNTTFKPRQGEINNQVMRILWSSVNVGIGPGWKANHFVPIFDQHKAESKTPRKRQASEMEGSPETKEVNESIEDEDACSDQSGYEIVPMEKAAGGQPIEFGKFVDVFEAFEKITTATEVHSGIPRGVKENVWFLIDNSHNVRHPERRNTFFDDCGVWDSKRGSVVKSYLLLDDTEHTIQCTLKQRGGVYRKRVKKGEWVVLDPQPDPSKVVVCRRYYTFLQRCNSYKRRITWFGMPHANDRGSEVALVEYLQDFPGFPRHAQSSSKHGRGGKSKYVRTDPKLLGEIATEIRSGNSMKPMKMYKEIQKRLGSNCTLRDARQIRNLKYSVLKHQKRKQGTEGGEIQMRMDGDKIEVSMLAPEAAEMNLTDEGGAAKVMETMMEENPIHQHIIQPGQPDATKMMEREPQGTEGDKTEVQAEVTMLAPEAAEMNLTDESGAAAMAVETTTEENQPPIIQHDQADETRGENPQPGSYVKLEDGQLAVTLIGADVNGVPDPSTETIIILNNLQELEAITGGEVTISQV